MKILKKQLNTNYDKKQYQEKWNTSKSEDKKLVAHIEQ